MQRAGMPMLKRIAFFCQAVVERFQPGDLVWVHDYHLLLLPQMLRAELPNAAIGFFSAHPISLQRNLLDPATA